MIRIYALLAVYYALGAIAIAAINRRRNDGESKARWTKLGVYVLITALFTSALYLEPRASKIIALLIVIGGGIEMLRLPNIRGARMALLFCGYAMIAILFCAFFVEVRLMATRAAMYVIVLSFDGWSQIAGQVVGGARIAPRISPGKTYSGLAGGLLMGLMTNVYLNRSADMQGLAVTCFICLLAFSGDMLASAVKRQAGVKDFSTLIPAHGGVLDRFDSFLFAGAALECAYFLIK